MNKRHTTIKDIAKAAELMGRVSTIPITTDTIIPIGIGCISVALFIIVPKKVITIAIYGPI